MYINPFFTSSNKIEPQKKAEKKNAAKNATISALVPGLSQLKNNRTNQGKAFMFGTYASFGVFLAGFFAKAKTLKAIPIEETTKKLGKTLKNTVDNFTKKDSIITVAALGVSALLWVANIIDAYQNGKNNNPKG